MIGGFWEGTGVGGWVVSKRGDPGIEPGTSCTLNRNHTTRPIARLVSLPLSLLLE